MVESRETISFLNPTHTHEVLSSSVSYFELNFKFIQEETHYIHDVMAMSPQECELKINIDTIRRCNL